MLVFLQSVVYQETYSQCLVNRSIVIDHVLNYRVKNNLVLDLIFHLGPRIRLGNDGGYFLLLCIFNTKRVCLHKRVVNRLGQLFSIAAGCHNVVSHMANGVQ